MIKGKTLAPLTSSLPCFEKKNSVYILKWFNWYVHFWHYLRHERQVFMLMQIRVIQTQDTNKLWATRIRMQCGYTQISWKCSGADASVAAWLLHWAQVTVCVDFHVCVGFFHVLGFPPTVQKICSMWIGYAKLAVGFEWWCPSVPSVIRAGFRSTASFITIKYLLKMNAYWIILFKNVFLDSQKKFLLPPSWAQVPNKVLTLVLLY